MGIMRCITRRPPASSCRKLRTRLISDITHRAGKRSSWRSKIGPPNASMGATTAQMSATPVERSKRGWRDAHRICSSEAKAVFGRSVGSWPAADFHPAAPRAAMAPGYRSLRAARTTLQRKRTGAGAGEVARPIRLADGALGRAPMCSVSPTTLTPSMRAKRHRPTTQIADVVASVLKKVTLA